MNDSELLRRLRRRDPAAVQWLRDCHLPSLWRFVYTRVGGDRHLAEDISNETILAMFTAIQSEFSAESEILNLAGWLRTVAGRRIADHYRAVSRVQHLLPQNHNSRSDCAGADPAKHQELQETRQQVRRAMDSMPEQYRMALEWKYLDQLSVREIAARWKMTEKAVESILFRARREFRDQMTQRELMEPSRNGSRSRIPDSTSNDSAKEDASSQVL